MAVLDVHTGHWHTTPHHTKRQLNLARADLAVDDHALRKERGGGRGGSGVAGGGGAMGGGGKGEGGGRHHAGGSATFAGIGGAAASAEKILS